MIVGEIRAQGGPTPHRSEADPAAAGCDTQISQRHGPVVAAQAHARGAGRLIERCLEGRAVVELVDRRRNVSVPKGPRRVGVVRRMAKDAELSGRWRPHRPRSRGREVVNRIPQPALRG